MCARTNLEWGVLVKETRVMINQPRQFRTIQEQHQKEKLLQSKLSQLLYVTCRGSKNRMQGALTDVVYWKE